MHISKQSTKTKSLSVHFDQIYIVYFSRMQRFAKEYVLSDEDAENIVQDVFVLLWEKREVLDVKVSLAAYLFALVKNKCLDHLRHQTVAQEYNQELHTKLSALEELNQVFSSDEDVERIVTKAVQALPVRCREVFIKSRMDGKKNKEIADELNISVNTVENQIGIALRKLRVELKDYLPLLLFITAV